MCLGPGTSQISFGPFATCVESAICRLLVRLPVLAVDEETDVRGSDLRDEALQICRRDVAREERRRRGDEAGADELAPVAAGFAAVSRTERPLAPSETIALSAVDSAAASIIISPPTERPMPPIRSRIDVGAVLQVRDRSMDVALALPAEQVRVAVALAFAATVEEQHAVAVARKHLRALLRRARGRGTR